MRIRLQIKPSITCWRINTKQFYYTKSDWLKVNSGRLRLEFQNYFTLFSLNDKTGTINSQQFDRARFIINFSQQP